MLGGNAIEHNDSVGQVGRHDEVVLHHEGRLLSMEDVPADTKLAGAMEEAGVCVGGGGLTDEPLDDAGGHQSLLGVQVR